MGVVDEDSFLSLMVSKFNSRELADNVKDVLELMDEYNDALKGESATICYCCYN